jgi:glutaredoxin
MAYMELVMYSMEDCPFCKHFARIFKKSLPDARIHMLDRNDDAEWIEKGIEFVPTVVVYKEGKDIDRISAVRMVGIRYPSWQEWIGKYGIKA